MVGSWKAEIVTESSKVELEVNVWMKSLPLAEGKKE